MAGLGAGAGAFEGAVEEGKLEIQRKQIAAQNARHQAEMRFKRDESRRAQGNLDREQANLDRAFAEKQRLSDREQSNLDRSFAEKQRLENQAQGNLDRAFAEKQFQTDRNQANLDRAFQYKKGLDERNNAWADIFNMQKMEAEDIQLQKNRAVYDEFLRIQDEAKTQRENMQQMMDSSTGALAMLAIQSPNGCADPAAIEAFNKAFPTFKLQGTMFDDRGNLLFLRDRDGQDDWEIFDPNKLGMIYKQTFGQDFSPIVGAYNSASGGSSRSGRTVSGAKSSSLQQSLDGIDREEARKSLSVIQSWLEAARARNVETKTGVPVNPELAASIKSMEAEEARLLGLIASYGRDVGSAGSGEGSVGTDAFSLFDAATGSKGKGQQKTAPAPSVPSARVAAPTSAPAPVQAKQAVTAPASAPAPATGDQPEQGKAVPSQGQITEEEIKANAPTYGTHPSMKKEELSVKDRESRRISAEDRLFDAYAQKQQLKQSGKAVPEEVEAEYQAALKDYEEHEKLYPRDESSQMHGAAQDEYFKLGRLRHDFEVHGEPVPEDVEKEYQEAKKKFHETMIPASWATPEQGEKLQEMHRRHHQLLKQRERYKKHGRSTAELDEEIKEYEAIIKSRKHRKVRPGSLATR